jgi:putative hemolysin
MHQRLRTAVQPAYASPRVDCAGRPVALPALFETYLRYGAKVCGGPAIDREFKTIDFLVLLDINDMDERAWSMFFGRQKDSY